LALVEVLERIRLLRARTWSAGLDHLDADGHPLL